MNLKWIEGKDLDDLLGMIVGTGEVGSAVHEQIKAAIGVEVAKLQTGGCTGRADVGEGVWRRHRR